ncbi:hypothetical protein LOTGIDRAFT_175181 [Lottia gigantea]|uniref:Uncharacterized protein n=1 Tax=Lottia gigantea TaxID=225164 RepID=V4AEG0_LOTGI|nr:hypothetical protein LOTGIDRAFT_175181 [Lottia gigantea]ESO95272.1 hypothetical protein LOTGIDRAFT_175181 [Lottia gigantea]
MASKNYRLDPIFQLYDPIQYSFNKKKEDYVIISPSVGTKTQINDTGRVTFEINSLSNWLLLSDAHFRCDFKIKDGAQNRIPQTNTTLENNFFPSLFSEMVLEAGSNPITTIKHPGEFDTMLKTVLYPKNYDSVSGWIPDVGDGEVLKEPVRNLANDADLARVRVVARNTLKRVTRGVNHGFEKRALQYNNVVENNRWETLVMKIIEAMETNSPTLITYNGKKVHITQKIIDKYKHCKVRDDIDLERIDENLTQKGGFLPFLPLIFAGLAAAGATAGGAAGIAKAVNDKKAEAAANAEARRHNLSMEREARGGLGVGDIYGTVKEFGQRFGEETKKTVKEGLSKLIDKIDTGEMKVKHKGDAIFFKNIRSGEGIFLSKYKSNGVIFSTKM